MSMSDIVNYNDAVQAIKTAILQAQYQAAKAGNAEQLRLYYAVGGYVSANTREGAWGTGAIEAISTQLQKELPGLRGFSTSNIKNMRMFYEAWRTDLSTPANSPNPFGELMMSVMMSVILRQGRQTSSSSA